MAAKGTSEIHEFRALQGVSRRTLVKAGIGAIAAPAVLRSIPANAQSRVIKIGHVSPRTGPLAGFGEADGFILEQVRGILSKGLQSGGRTYQVQIISKDSQSSGSRAAEVASELILGDKVDLIVASATPDTTNPVADQAEVNEVPCITTNCPGSPTFSDARAIRPRASPGPITSSGVVEDVIGAFLALWDSAPPTRSWAVSSPTMPTATPGAIRSVACRRHWLRRVTSSPIPAAISS
jgi:ABC-type branched-chain amino acid transport systems, periplasmic component